MNSSFIVDVAMGKIPRSTERISSFCIRNKPDDHAVSHAAISDIMCEAGN